MDTPVVCPSWRQKKKRGAIQSARERALVSALECRCGEGNSPKEVN
jgi:hypothetical protein